MLMLIPPIAPNAILVEFISIHLMLMLIDSVIGFGDVPAGFQYISC